MEIKKADLEKVLGECSEIHLKPARALIRQFEPTYHLAVAELLHHAENAGVFEDVLSCLQALPGKSEVSFSELRRIHNDWGLVPVLRIP